MDEDEKAELEQTKSENKAFEQTGQFGFYRQKEEMKALQERLIGARAKVYVDEKISIMDIKSDHSSTSSVEIIQKKRPWNYLSPHPMDFISSFEEDDVPIYSSRLQNRRDNRNKSVIPSQEQSPPTLPSCEPTAVTASSLTPRRRPGNSQQPMAKATSKAKTKITIDNLKLF